LHIVSLAAVDPDIDSNTAASARLPSFGGNRRRRVC
jgi:hypothetical protein